MRDGVVLVITDVVSAKHILVDEDTNCRRPYGGGRPSALCGPYLLKRWTMQGLKRISFPSSAATFLAHDV
jgi:hypothetical protein